MQNVVDCLSHLGSQGDYLKQMTRDKLIEHKHYIDQHGQDLPEILNWMLSDSRWVPAAAHERLCKSIQHCNPWLTTTRFSPTSWCRPIAWISSLSPGGVVNLAPFSFFNAVGAEPLYLVVSIGRRDNGTPKDTAHNIDASGEFVVNLVTEDLLIAMNISAADFPPDQSEVTAAGLLSAPSVCVTVPRLAQAQASLECRLFQSLPLARCLSGRW